MVAEERRRRVGRQRGGRRRGARLNTFAGALSVPPLASGGSLRGGILNDLGEEVRYSERARIKCV